MVVHLQCLKAEQLKNFISSSKVVHTVMLERYDDMGELDQDELDSLFVELCGSGYRQVSATLLWLLLFVSEFPDVQNKVYEELVSVVGKDRLPQLSDQPYLPYTCSVLLETRRLATVMPFMYPHSTTEDTSFMGLRSCPGESLVDISLFMFTTHFLYQLNFKMPVKADLVLNLKPFKVLISPRDAVAVEVMEAPTETIVSFLNGEELLKS